MEVERVSGGIGSSVRIAVAPRAATVVIEPDAEIPVATGSIDRTGRDTVNALTVR